MQESDPRYLRVPNFYFPQEDLLWSWCDRHSVPWNVTRPGFIVGAVPNAAMNIAYGLAVYASIQAELGATLEYPGSVLAWDMEKHLSAAELIAHHAEWAALTDATANEILNVADDSLFTYSKFWPALASWYGLPYGVPGPTEKSITMPVAPPPRGFGGPGKVEVAWSFQDWARREEVQTAWKRLEAKHGLLQSPFDDITAVFGVLDGDISGP